ncbi:Hypothetical predicted protein [Lynx pardinus]|uniref:40S ribosomal protein S2 n=1 Tax=Lynx pardinus TaxID=191816 RepID=A0A485MJX8_LYNPA|nr:Hypothetical predicted protein [Lynx pardinus]
MKIMSLVEISLFSLPIKESEIIDFFFVLGASVKDEWTRFKVFVASRDYNGHAVLGIKCSMVATAIHGAIVLARFSIVPVRRGYWRNKIHKPHTMPRKVTCCCGSVPVHLIPAQRHWLCLSLCAQEATMMAGIYDCYTSARGCTATLWATLPKLFLMPFPRPTAHFCVYQVTYQEFTDRLTKDHIRVSVQRTQAPTVTSI